MKGSAVTPMPDLEFALQSFQTALTSGAVELQRGSLDRDLFVHCDQPNGELRLTYVRLDGDTVTAMAVFVMAEHYEGLPCFNVGWAVPLHFRGQGRATEVFLAAANELSFGLGRNGPGTYYMEAVIDAENEASKRVAEKVLSTPLSVKKEATDDILLVQYIRKFTTGQEIFALR